MDWISRHLDVPPPRLAVAGVLMVWTVEDPAEKEPVGFFLPVLTVRSMN